MIRYVAPHRATGPGDFTLLIACGRRLTKKITEAGIDDYEGAMRFEVDARHVDGIDDIPRLLEELALRSDTCVIRAALKREFADRPLVLRRVHDRPDPARPGHIVVAPFAPAPRAWVMVDFEPTDAPAYVDPTDPVIAGGYLRQQLPPAFRVARGVAQLSASAGLRPGLRCHLYFWLSHALSKPELDLLLGGVPGIDCSVFGGVQPNYTAAPVFSGVDDPCHERIAVLPGYPVVEIGELPEPRRPRATFTPISIGGAGGGGAERYAAACLRRLALAPEGERHRTCLTISCRLLALAKGGEIDPLRVGSMIKGVMQGKGFDGRGGRDLGEVDRILAWAWQTVSPEELPR